MRLAGLVENETLKILRRKRFRVVLEVPREQLRVG